LWTALKPPAQTVLAKPRIKRQNTTTAVRKANMHCANLLEQMSTSKALDQNTNKARYEVAAQAVLAATGYGLLKRSSCNSSQPYIYL
jgi:hypothetical protein